MIAIYIILGILGYLLLSVLYGVYVFFLEKNSVEIMDKQADKMEAVTDWYFNNMGKFDKYPKLTSIGLLLLAIIFSGPTARFIKGGDWLGGAAGFEDEFEDEVLKPTEITEYSEEIEREKRMEQFVREDKEWQRQNNLKDSNV